MKPKTKKTRQRVDEIGKQYEDACLLIDQGNVAVGSLKEESEALVTSAPEASRSAKGAFITGTKYVIGFYDRGGGIGFNDEAFLKENPKLAALCTRKITVFDEDAFMAAVRDGKIDKKTVNKYRFNKSGSRVVYIKRLSEHA